MDQLKEQMKKFRDITQELLNVLEKDSYDELDQLFSERQQAIYNIEGLDYNADEFKMICEEYGILSLQQNLANLMNEKHAKLKAEMKGFLENKNANKSYNHKFTVDSIYFNKKI